MKTIPKPVVKVREVFTICISDVQNAVLKTALSNCTAILETAETDFENRFVTLEIYQIARNLTVLGAIGKEQMETVYNYRMVQKAGRVYYDQLKSAAPNGKCPLCSVREVQTLDHYLPKSKYPVYAVTPINLIPACSDCNTGKKVDYPTNSENQTLHPYYDNVENESWLKAQILQTNPTGFDFYVDCPGGWTNALKERVANHFASFNLNGLFSSHANEEFRGIKTQLVNQYNHHPDEMRAHLQACAESRLALGINSWQAVMYRALLNDAWFCSGGVLI